MSGFNHVIGYNLNMQISSVSLWTSNENPKMQQRKQFHFYNSIKNKIVRNEFNKKFKTYNWKYFPKALTT